MFILLKLRAAQVAVFFLLPHENVTLFSPIALFYTSELVATPG